MEPGVGSPCARPAQGASASLATEQRTREPLTQQRPLRTCRVRSGGVGEGRRLPICLPAFGRNMSLGQVSPHMEEKLCDSQWPPAPAWLLEKPPGCQGHANLERLSPQPPLPGASVGSSIFQKSWSPP